MLHSQEAFQEGSSVILTLKDKGNKLVDCSCLGCLSCLNCLGCLAGVSSECKYAGFLDENASLSLPGIT